MRQVAEDGLGLDPGITVVIGPNGAGKSTLAEAVAAVPGVRILHLDQDGITAVEFDVGDLVRTLLAFLEAPGRYLRHLD